MAGWFTSRFNIELWMARAEFFLLRMLAADGDTAVYLNYAHARMCSILRKLPTNAGFDPEAFLEELRSKPIGDVIDDVAVDHASEATLLHVMGRAADTL